MSSPFDDLLKQIPIGDIAKQVGIDPSLAEIAVTQILPTLVGGMAANAQDTGGADALTKALASHKDKLGSVSSVKDIDTKDGDKIVSHVFGTKKDDVVKAVADNKGVAQDIIAQILPIVAPIVLAWVANQFFGNKSTSTTEAAAPEASGGIGDLLGGLLGGMTGGSSNNSGGDLLGGLIGGLLGGKN